MGKEEPRIVDAVATPAVVFALEEENELRAGELLTAYLWPMAPLQPRQ
jgi:hypothetical protein